MTLALVTHLGGNSYKKKLGPKNSDAFRGHLIQIKRRVGGREKPTDVCPAIGAMISDLNTSDTFRWHSYKKKFSI